MLYDAKADHLQNTKANLYPKRLYPSTSIRPVPLLSHYFPFFSHSKLPVP